MARHIHSMCYRIAAVLAALMSVEASAQQPTPASPPPFVVRRTGVPSRRPTPEERRMETIRRRADFIQAKDVDDAAKRLGGRVTRGETVLTSSDEQSTFLLVHRTVSSEPEVHARWDDVIMVRAGTGGIELGDSLVGSQYRAPGERKGGTITMRYSIVVRAGDMIRIPAGVPHAFTVSRDSAVDYLVLKQRRQNLPIRWFGDTSKASANR
jgi:mannose-6-phosphate isomerase-like protein (cupin superfamily)